MTDMKPIQEVTEGRALMQDAASLFEEAIEWLRLNYHSYCFYVERDLVWTVQERLRTTLAQHSLPYRVFHHFPMFPGMHRVVNSDLALVGPDNRVIVAAEFKYEPSHDRSKRDIWHTKFPVVFWREGVGEDVARVQRFVMEGAAVAGYAVFIDEGRWFRHLAPHPGSDWIDWGPAAPGALGPAVLWTCARR